MPAPSYDQVVRIPAVAERIVGPEHADANGHMNIQHYLGLNSDGWWAFLQATGLPAPESSGIGFFDIEHHLRYFDEVCVGDRISIHYRMLARGPRTVHAMSFIVDHERRSLANTLEWIAVCVDLATRRPTDMGAPAAGILDREIAASEELDWPAPTCGFLGIRAAT